MSAATDGNDRANAWLHLIALLVLAAVTTLQVPVAQPLRDAFQEAEYAMFGRARAPGEPAPVLIHGGLDVVPSRIAALACPNGVQVVCVRTVNAVLTLATTTLVLAVLMMLTGLGSAAAFVATLPAAAMLWLFNGPTSLASDGHQATPGLRDLFVAAGLLVMARAAVLLDRRAGRVAWWMVLLGLLAGIGVFWSYNRGLVLGLVGGTFACGVALARRSVWPAVAYTGGVALGLGGVLAVGGFALANETAFDIQYWAANSGLWKVPPNLLTVAPLVLGAGLVLVPAALNVSRAMRTRPGHALLLATLMVVFVLYAVQSLNRPDLGHLRWVVWPGILLAGACLRAWLDAGPPRPVRADAAAMLVLIALGGACLETLSPTSIGRPIMGGLLQNLVTATHPLPTDRELAAPDMVHVADIVRAHGGCTFAADNGGIVHLLSGVPACSRFVFGVYVGPAAQAEVIATLEASRPPIILWDGPDWWSRIDRRPFWERAPVLAAWIEREYPVQTAVGARILRSREALQP